ncbi:hypothetical protein D3C87_1552350 [compost metagenome]
MGSMPSSLAVAISLGSSLRKRRADAISKLIVFMRPWKASPLPLSFSTGVTLNPACASDLAVPPLAISSTFFAARTFARSRRPVLSETLKRALLICCTILSFQILHGTFKKFQSIRFTSERHLPVVNRCFGMRH